MELGFDLLADLKGRLAGGRSDADAHGLDWPGLHARMSAAHAARHVLAAAARPAGSFAGCLPTGSAGVFRSINLNDSTDGKAPESIEVLDAGDNMAGDRGQ